MLGIGNKVTYLITCDNFCRDKHSNSRLLTMNRTKWINYC